MNHSCKGQSSRLECAWIYQFAPVPKDIQATAVVKGPFSSTLLMETTPIIEMLVNLPKNRERVSLRTGIPDSWSEFVLFEYLKNLKALKSVKNETALKWCSKNNLKITEDLHKQFHLPFQQGIPDPWKNWPKRRPRDTHAGSTCKTDNICVGDDQKLKKKSKF